MTEKLINIECKDCSAYEKGILKSLEMNKLQELVSCKNSYSIKKGTIIFEEGDMLTGVYCIKEGVCKLTKLSLNGKNQIVRFVKKGDILGQYNIVGKQAANLTATALKDMKICFIPKEQILTSFAENPNFSTEIIREMSAKLQKADNIIVDLAQKNVKQRLADTLLFLKETFGEDTQGYIDIQLSREEIANIVGTATESLIRMLSEFSKNKYIETHCKYIKILDQAKLKRVSVG
ncbi:Crp/Fnr family transcriptional regulator [Capnocytophaga catalasegens]|uniref:Crp/Fnr family transcriptional regulator n=1 Tax=Capnocytophaga catalasegens TaxID=1004260 RepID=A0AAV5AYI4_9FLAO|nr:Crp/Fnr family transcriptional regulator [Capnocytophaga catalasegens]GIZ15357.1 Crp/Fnr family transcriptional regulator [Capnocytophaga catalasegens]GJM50945.1 Crp/Fnr family transcriptional regulator [Capnocytophaga catalasegens]GJM52129.1 Crp/Fnr family transcriptional regulator [Capnocytophaga catalasegens]